MIHTLLAYWRSLLAQHQRESTETREDRARRIVRDHAEEIAASRHGATFKVPGCGGRVYFVSLSRQFCECPDHEHTGGTCKHLFAATLVAAKMRSCSGCGERFLGRDLYEVPADNLTFFEGDRLCRPCALAHRVL